MKQKLTLLISHKALRAFLLSAFLLTALSHSVYSQWDIYEVNGKASQEKNRKRGIQMLKDVRDALEKYYYDKSFRGMNLEERFRAAEEKIKRLETNSEIFRVIATVVLDLGDSHTVFYPPGVQTLWNTGLQPKWSVTNA